jgi:hypothetical protein
MHFLGLGTSKRPNVSKNHFAPEDFEALIVQAATRGDTMRQVLALLREPPLPGQIAIPYPGDLNIYEQVLGIVAGDKVTLNAGGHWWHKEPGESSNETLTRLKQRASFSGQAMFAVQLGETSQVGSGGVAATPPITPTKSPTASGLSRGGGMAEMPPITPGASTTQSGLSLAHGPLTPNPIWPPRSCSRSSVRRLPAANHRTACLNLGFPSSVA